VSRHLLSVVGIPLYGYFGWKSISFIGLFYEWFISLDNIIFFIFGTIILGFLSYIEYFFLSLSFFFERKYLIFHSISGSIGVILYLIVCFQNPIFLPQILFGEYNMWSYFPIKTFFSVFPYLGTIGIILYSLTYLPYKVYSQEEPF